MKNITNLTNTKPLFVVGAPRSGTTLLTQILSKHPDIFVFNETLFYDYVTANDIDGELSPESLQKLALHLKSRIDARIEDINGQTEFGCRFDANQASEIKSRFDAELNLVSDKKKASDVLDIFMSIITQSKGRRVWGDKTPNHVFHLKRIIADFPSAKVIYIVRDPRKFLISYKFSWRQKGSRKDVAKLYNPIITSNLWKRSDRSFYNFKGSGQNVFLVKYEDLIEEGDKKIREIVDFIEESYDANMRFVKGENSSFSGKREKLTYYEKSICEFICRNEMKRYGYEPETSLLIGAINSFISVFTLPLFFAKALPVVSNHFKGGLFRYLKARGIFG